MYFNKIFLWISTIFLLLNISVHAVNLTPEQIDFIKSQVHEKGFSIIRTLGKGEFGVILLGKTSSSEFVCLKCVDSHSFSEHEFEIFHIKDIRECQNITTSFEKIEIDCSLVQIPRMIVLSCEFNNGGTLLEKCEYFKRKFCEREVLEVILDVSNALQTLHRNGYIHRDIKPDNIMIHDSRYRLIDFGLVLKKDDKKTKQGFIPYKSPEFLLFTMDQHKDYNEKIDIWALGVMSYQLLYGRPPFVQRDIDNKLLPIYDLLRNACSFCLSLEGTPPFASEPLNRLIRSCFFNDPENRTSADILYLESQKALKICMS